jgi:DNA-directed RNA polymerase specialized sigma subunit
LRKYITLATSRCNKDYQSKEQLQEAAEAARSLSARQRAWDDRRWHGKMSETSSRQPVPIWLQLDHAHRKHRRHTDPFLVSETDLTARYGFSSADEFADYRDRAGFPEPDKVGRIDKWRAARVLNWERGRRRAPPKVDVSARIERTCILPNGEHGGNTRSFRDDRCDALHPKTEHAARAAERKRKKREVTRFRLKPHEWDKHARLAKAGNQRSLKILWEAAIPFATALAAPFCARNTSLSAEALAIEALYPLGKKTGMPVFGLMSSLGAWDPGRGRAFVWYLRDLVEKNITKSIRSEKLAPSLDVGDDDDVGGFDFEAALAAFDEMAADLTDQERHVLTCRRNGDTDIKISDGLRLSRERVRQIRISAINKLTR